MGRFKFTGKVVLPKDGSDRHFINRVPIKNGKQGIRCSFGILSDSSIGYVEGFGYQVDVIKTRTTDGKNLDVKWNDRHNADIIKNISSFKKCVIDLGEAFGGKKEFITEYDVLEYLAEVLPKYDGKIMVTGQARKKWYKDKYYDKYIFDNIYAVSPDTKTKLYVELDFYYRASFVDKDIWASDRIIKVDGYVPQYMGKEEGIRYIPQTLVFNATKYDLKNERHCKLLEYKLKYIDIKSKAMVHLMWECRLVNGAQPIEFDDTQLTKEQKQQVELGVHDVSYYKPHVSIYGEKVNEIRMFDPKLTGDFSSGYLECDMTNSEFEELIHKPAKEENLVNKANTKTNTEDSIIESIKSGIDTDDLF